MSPPPGTEPALEPLDLLVLGSGVAGLSAAVHAAGVHGMRVGVLTKGELDQATTRWAQGGVAAALGQDPDSTDLHLADTLAAGAGLCDADAVRVLVDEGPGRVNELISLGAIFDRDEHGVLELAREGGHTLPRVVHAGGAATGAEIERALVAAVQRTAAALHENAFALDLILEGGECVGVRARRDDGEVVDVRATNVLMATGGAGQLFAVTTNPVESTGDGIAMALRAGVAVADVEFVQFHPTALHHPKMPRPLLSEALRGHGALVRDVNGERFVDELLPHDEVSRAMTGRMLDLGVDHCLLDATGLENFDQRFPTIAAALREVELDPATDWLPIAPAAHYISGGIVTDLDGASTAPGLWAAGETACSGVHGANRLASNSLLEGMVFGFRVVEAIDRGRRGAEVTGAMRAVAGGEPAGDVIGGRPVPQWSAPARLVTDADRVRSASGAGALAGDEAGEAGDDDVSAPADALDKARLELQRAMTNGAGVLRSAASLTDTASVVDGVRDAVSVVGGAPAAELRNLADVAGALLASAHAREESRGSHTRTDFRQTEAAFRTRLTLGS